MHAVSYLRWILSGPMMEMHGASSPHASLPKGAHSLVQMSDELERRLYSEDCCALARDAINEHDNTSSQH